MMGSSFLAFSIAISLVLVFLRESVRVGGV
jgi:hypothetical protein